MDIKLMLTTFGMVFLAELGDKTQLATFCLSADCGTSKWTVFFGSAGALVLSSFLAVLLGDAVAKLVPPHFIKIGAGAFFIVVGLYTLYTAYKGVCSL